MQASTAGIPSKEPEGADDDKTCDTSLVNHDTLSSASSKHRLWTPATPIVFGDGSRTMRRDFTWKRGNAIVFGPGFGSRVATRSRPESGSGPGLEHCSSQRRSYASKTKASPPPRPAKPSASPSRLAPRPYQPRTPQRGSAEVINPSDLDFLDPIRKRVPAPTPSLRRTPPSTASTTSDASPASQAVPPSSNPPLPSQPSPDQHASAESGAGASTAINELVASMSSEQPNTTTSAVPNLSAEQLLRQAFEVSDLASSKRQAIDDSADSTHDSSLVDEFAKANHALQAALRAMQAKSRAQDQEYTRSIANHQKQMKKMDADRVALLEKQDKDMQAVSDKLLTAKQRIASIQSTMRADHNRAVGDTLAKHAELQREHKALVEANKRLQYDLDEALDPRAFRLNRLRKSQEYQTDQDTRERLERSKEKRLAQRATYTTFQEFFQLGSKDISRWLNGDIVDHQKLDSRIAAYWNKASASLASFIKNTRSKDEERYRHVRDDASNRSLSAKETAALLRKHRQRRRERDDHFRRLSVHLAAQATEADQHVVSHQDHYWHFEAQTWGDLKVYSHELRRLLRILHFNHETSPAYSDQQSFLFALRARVDTPLREVQRSLLVQMEHARILQTRAKDARTTEHWSRRRVAMQTMLDLLFTLREVVMRHDEFAAANWIMHEPLATVATISTVDHLRGTWDELRVRTERCLRTFARLGIDTKHSLFKFHDIYFSRKYVGEFENIAYRNTFLAERYDRLDETVKARLEAILPRQYQDASQLLKLIIRASSDHRISQWAAQIIRNRSKRRKVQFDQLDDPDALTVASLTTPKQAVPIDNTLLIRRIASKKTDNLVQADPVPIDDTLVNDDFGDSPMDDLDSINGSSANDSTPPLPVDSPEEPVLSPPNDDAAPSVPVQEELPDKKPALHKSRPKPSYKALKVTDGDVSRRASGVIQPHKGVLPKPDYGRRQRHRALFKPTRLRRQSFQDQSSIAEEKLVLEHEDEHEDKHEGQLGSPIDSIRSSDAHVLPRIQSPTASAMGGASIDVHSESSTTVNTSSQTLDPDPVSSESQSVHTKEIHVPLKYQIPQQELRKAHMASPASGAAFWKYSLYKGPVDEPGDGRINIHYCTKFDQAEKQAKLFFNESVIGFDVEWEPGSSVDKSGIKDNVSLIQIASENRIALFQIASFHGDTVEELMPPSLRAVLESPDIVKAGVNIGGDYTRLNKCFGIQGQGLFELSHLYKVIKYGASDPHKVDRKPVRMADQVQEFLFLPLAKGAVRTSAWSRRLTPEQVEYAASDAYAGFRLYDAMEAKRKEMYPTPPRPAFYELKLPILLGDGKPPPPKKKVVVASKPRVDPDAPVPATEASAADVEVVLDEALDDVQEAKESEDEFYSCPSETEEPEDDDVPDDNEREVPSNSETSSPRSAIGLAPTPSELAKAEKWLEEWRAKFAPDRKPRATPACLRAYALWYSQSLGVGETAAVLRNPPLALSSVAQYILEAVKQEDLDFQPSRLREVFGFIPPSFSWRYSRLAGKLQNMEANESLSSSFGKR